MKGDKGDSGGGLSTVASNATLTGNGTSGSPLAVANPFTDADEAKLNGIAAQATRNVEQFITQAAYDALSSKDANTTYFITG